MQVGIIGAGKLAEKLAMQCCKSNIDICFIANRTEEKLTHLFAEISLIYPNVNQIQRLNLKDEFPIVDLVFMCVSDDSIFSVSQLFPDSQSVISLSGSYDSLSSLNEKNSGVFYPLMSFSKQMSTPFEQIPCFIEATNVSTLEKLYEFAILIHVKVEFLPYSKRSILHLTAVFANNFVNHLYAQAEQILDKNGLEMNYLLPLINETSLRLKHQTASESQTGPALRNDVGTFEIHLSLMNQQQKDIYNVLTKSIQTMYNVETNTNNENRNKL